MRRSGFFPDRYDHLRGNTGQVAVVGAILGTESERNERWPGSDDIEPELAGEVVTERGGAHFGDGEAAGGYHQSGSAELAGFGEDHEFRGALDFSNFAAGKN